MGERRAALVGWRGATAGRRGSGPIPSHGSEDSFVSTTERDTRMRRFLAVGLSLVFVVGAAGCGGGDDAGQQTSDAAQQGQSAEPRFDVSDAELQSFIQASMELESFQQEMRTRMQEAADSEEGRQIRQQLMQERDSIIEASGLTGAARYDTIMQAVKTSDSVQERYTTLRDSMEAESAAADTAS